MEFALMAANADAIAELRDIAVEIGFDPDDFKSVGFEEDD
ncbi:protein of unknown function [uncultured Woeseiaceae bacterium]|uniref:Uncharacterized protein n=1 Tax=uncultured Woeseiaceae bacterium TaxID=1983305 RepID=A0A7D9H3T8_9GAMM|nr:protein of unknown function [uncultured Woeseiaceae bacterium]